MQLKNILINIFVFIICSLNTWAQTRTLLNDKADSLLKTKPTKKEFSFVVFGDAQRADTLAMVNDTFAIMLNEIKNNDIKPDFVVLAGDFVYSGTYAQYDTFYNLVTAWMDTTGIPFFCLPGNHNFTGNTGYQNYLDFIDKDLDYYFDYGNNRFILINNVNSLNYTNYNVKQSQIDTIAKWMIPEKERKFVFGHVSLVRSFHNSGLGNPGYSQLLYALESGGMTAWFNGHIHDYMVSLYNNTYHINTGGAGGYQIGLYNPPVSYNGHHWLLVSVDACKGVSVNMYRYGYGHDNIAKLYDLNISESLPVVVSAQQKDVSCFGEMDGKISLNAGGGVAPGCYNYLWSNAATSSCVDFLQAGVYTVTVSDSTGCYAKENYTVAEPSPLNTYLDIMHVKCAGENTGSVEAVVTGGVPPYEYLWSGGKTTQSVFNLYTGVYHVTVTDSNQCKESADVVVTEPQMLISYPVVSPDTSLQCKGSIKLEVSGGVFPYFYKWNGISDAPDMQEITGICEGDYSVTVTDFNGCSRNHNISVNNIPAGIDNAGTNSFNVWPDPASDYLIADIPSSSGLLQLVVFTEITGRVIPVTDFQDINENTLLIKIPENLKGIYFIRLKTSEGWTLPEKIIIL